MTHVEWARERAQQVYHRWELTARQGDNDPNPVLEMEDLPTIVEKALLDAMREQRERNANDAIAKAQWYEQRNDRSITSSGLRISDYVAAALREFATHIRAQGDES